MLVDDLPADVRESFLTAYDMERNALRELTSSRDKAEAAARDVPVPDAFLDGVSLLRAMNSVYSADSWTEYEHDIASYDSLAARLNEKYGDVAVLSSKSSDLGLRGHRRAAFTTMTETVRGDDGKETVTVVDLAAAIEHEDEAVRSRERSRRPSSDGR